MPARAAAPRGRRRPRDRCPSRSYVAVCDALRGLGAHVEQGVFGADMQVTAVNDGPITLILEREAVRA